MAGTALVLVIVGAVLVVYGANGSMKDRLGEVNTSGFRRTVARSGARASLRGGLVLVALGLGLFFLAAVLHTIMFVLTLAVIGAIVVAVVAAVGALHR